MFTQLIRIGRDAELRHTPAGKAVINLAGAYDVGWGENKKTQWIECAIWDKRAEALSQYLIKGGQCVVTLDDIEIETYQGKEGPVSKLKGRVIDLKLCGPKPSEQHPQEQRAREQPAQQAPPQAAVEDFDDDIPFN